MVGEHDDQVGMGNVVAGYGKAIEVDSPYYLHPSDHPGLVFVTHPLTENGENYFTWRRNMMTALESKNKVGFIDNSVTKPNVNSQDFQPWVKCNAIVLSWLTNSLAKEIQSSAAHTETASELWADLHERFTQGIAPRIYEIKRNIALLQQEKAPISTYYGKLKGVWGELQALNPIPIFSCGCTCGAARKMQSMRESEKVYDFLMGLDDTFTTIRSQILSVDPLPTLGQSYAIAAQEETQKLVAASCTPMIETTTLLAKGKKTSGHDNGERQQRCNHCNKLNHTNKTCYQLVGYPSHWTRKPTRDARFGGYVNAPHTGVGAALAATVSNPDIQNQSPIPGLTAAQHQQLIALLGGSSVNTRSTPNPAANFAGKERIPWIIDTGATNHITCDPDSLLGAVPNSHIPHVQIPNGDSIPMQSLGRINLSGELILEQVLGVKGFCFNLLSVSKLARDLNCALTFWADLCVIQDLPSMRPIGAGKERNGLYYLERMGAGKALMANAKGDAALWHRRSGHIPMNRLTLVPRYPNGKKGYRIFDLEDKHIYTSRDVQFFEENYPFARHNTFVAPHESQQPDSSVFGPHVTMDSPLDVVHVRNKPDDIIQTVVPSSESNCAIPGLHSNEQQTEPKEVVEGSDPNKIIYGALDGNNSTPESNSSLSEISIPAKRVRKVSSKLSGFDYVLPPSIAPPCSPKIPPTEVICGGNQLLSMINCKG
ncbi:hypothetical protein RJ639_044065 [Escallonia herrerae]|uniref:Retrotransposon Copia-like N-terminal domain-containing protein n=1 Tax=Escallonia herrerae TaxID=1293975 RepID=A0AA88WDF7_9ASTE|nr:hypothetical protein RJ639_044065 [Escallonia herrerae]